MDELTLEAMQYKIEVLQSQAGFYIGQLDSDGYPFSRLSGYFPTKEKAAFALNEAFEPRVAVETMAILEALVRQGHLEPLDERGLRLPR